MVEEKEPGVWLIRTASVIPDNERWLHETQAASDLASALEWSEQQPASEIQTDALLAAAAQSDAPVRLDLDNPVFQEHLLGLQKPERHAANHHLAWSGRQHQTDNITHQTSHIKRRYENHYRHRR